MDKRLTAKQARKRDMEKREPYHCSLIVVTNGRLEFAPNITRVNNDDCICKAFGKIMSILDESDSKEVYVTFEKPEKDMDIVYIDIWPGKPSQYDKSIFSRRASSLELAIVMGILGSKNSSETVDRFENSKYTATLKIELVSIV